MGIKQHGKATLEIVHDQMSICSCGRIMSMERNCMGGRTVYRCWLCRTVVTYTEQLAIVLDRIQVKGLYQS